jgi:hypothetical protein
MQGMSSDARCDQWIITSIAQQLQNVEWSGQGQYMLWYAGMTAMF